MQSSCVRQNLRTHLIDKNGHAFKHRVAQRLGRSWFEAQRIEVALPALVRYGVTKAWHQRRQLLGDARWWDDGGLVGVIATTSDNIGLLATTCDHVRPRATTTRNSPPAGLFLAHHASTIASISPSEMLSNGSGVPGPAQDDSITSGGTCHGA